MKYLIHIFLFFLPLLYTNVTAQRFELTKYVWFLVVGVGLLGVMWVWKIVKTKKISWSLVKEYKKWWWIVVAYGGYLLLNTFIALSPSVSFWGSYERHQGLLLYIGLGVFLWVLSTLQWKKQDVLDMLRTIILSGVVVSLYAVIQFFTPGVFGDVSVTLGRLYASMGHPNFLGQYLLGTILLTLYFVYKTYKPRKQGWYWYLGAFALQTLVLLMTLNRASIVAFVIGIAVLGFASVLSTLPKSKRNIFSKWCAGITVLVLVFLIPLLVQVLQGGQASRSVLTRVQLYPSIVEAVSTSPLVGFGLDSFGYAFTPFTPSTLGETENFTNVADKAHNLVLDILMEQGVFGLLMLIAIFSYLFWITIKRWKEIPLDKKELLVCVWTTLLALTISFLAGFAVIPNKIIMVFLIFVLLIFLSQTKEQKEEKIEGTLFWGVLAPTTLVSVLVCLFGIQTFVADAYYQKALVEKDSVLMEQAFSWSPFPYEYYIFGTSFFTDREERKQLLAKAQKQNPYDYFIPLQEGRIAMLEEDADSVDAKFKRAQGLCPNCPYVYSYWTRSLSSLGRIGEGVFIVERYYQLLPSFTKKQMSELTPYEKERLRIFLKENKTDYFYMSDKRIKMLEDAGLFAEAQEMLERFNMHKGFFEDTQVE